MKIIVGLGNPGTEYDNTRHNAGFWFLDKLKENYDFPEFSLNNKFDALLSKGLLGKTECLLIKPQTFMNLSGKSIKAVLDFYKLSPQELIVIHDDLDIPLEKSKLADNSSSAGHNGVQSIIDNLGTQEFRRIRIGIRQEQKENTCRVNAHVFVLEKFSPEEKEKLERIYPDIREELKKILEQ